MVIGFVFAGLASLVLGTVAKVFQTRTRLTSPKTTLAFAAFPFACLAWVAVVFVFQATINGVLLGRDPGIGDGFECPLPNGYAITAIDTLDEGWICKPKVSSDSVFNDPLGDQVGGVTKMQVAG